ncbi:hypothetical protein LTR53_005103 [Teratosphaeriaceae sp. CCFEE 6253]|nr:hypothetical protein LTR53_005103 [Teratosphaeriaceae sp. CCFEE 6253]
MTTAVAFLLDKHRGRTIRTTHPGWYIDYIFGFKQHDGQALYKVRWKDETISEQEFILTVIDATPLRDWAVMIRKNEEKPDFLDVCWKATWEPIEHLGEQGELIHQYWSKRFGYKDATSPTLFNELNESTSGVS